jgi:hypothetical protein
LNNSEKVKLFLELLKDKEVQEALFEIIDTFLVTSHHQLPKRIATLEKVTGIDDFPEAEGEEHVPSIPEKIEIIEKKFEEIKVNPTIPVPEFKEPTTQAQKIGCFLRNTALKSKKGALNNTEMMNILKKNKLPEDCRPKEGIKNFRKLKKDALDAVKEMYNDVFISKLDKGRHETRLVINRNLT